jgi:HEAT repeat protein
MSETPRGLVPAAEEATPALRRALDGKDAKVREAAARALEKIGR